MPEAQLTNQLTDTGDEEWSRRSCGICVLKILMVFRKPELQNVPIMTLLNQAFEKGGYMENVGWKHQALIDLAALYGVPIGFQKEFFDTPEKKKEGIKIVNEKVKNGLPVAASVLKEFSLPNTAHLVVIESLHKAGPFGLGYRIADPYPGQRGNKYTVSKKEFLAGWRGGMLWLK